MTIEINHHPIEVGEECRTLAQLLEQEELAKPGNAVAVNNRVVPRADWATFELLPDMKLTVITAVCGG